jgi:DNA-binding transcriptional ArsR family regulator
VSFSAEFIGQELFEDLVRLSRMRLEQIIASSCRQKMLLALAKVRKTHVTQLVRMINSTYNQVNRNLVILENEKIIKTERLGYLRIVELNRENPKTLALLKALELLDKPIPNSKTSVPSESMVR